MALPRWTRPMLLASLAPTGQLPGAHHPRPGRRWLVGLSLVMGLVAPAGAVAVCHGYEYGVALLELYSWPARGLYLARVERSVGQEDAARGWLCFDRELRPGGAACDALALDDDAEFASRGARLLQRSTECLGKLAPCSASMAGRTWSCEVQRSETWNKGAGLQSVGCFEDDGRTLLLTETWAHTGADCDTEEQWLRLLPPLVRDACPECRTGFSSHRQPAVVPVLRLAPGTGPLFTPLGFDREGRLLFRFRASGGASGVGSFDPAMDALRTRGVSVPAPLQPLSATARTALGGSFEARGATFTIAPVGPAIAPSNELELAPRGASLPSRAWSATLVSERRGLQPFAAAYPRERAGADSDPAWHLIAQAPGSRHLVAVASVQQGAAIDLAFFSAGLGDGAFPGWRDPPPVFPESTVGYSSARVIGFSRSGLFAYVPDANDERAPVGPGPDADPDTVVAIVRLVDDRVMDRLPLRRSAPALQRLAIVPGLFAELFIGDGVFSVGERAYRVERDGDAVVLTSGGASRVIGRLRPDELFERDQAVDEIWVAVSPFEPRAAVLVPTPKGARVFGARL